MDGLTDLTQTASSSFEEIASYATDDTAKVEGDIYIGSEFSVTLGCNPFFRPIIEEKSPVRLNVMRVGIVKSGWCEPIVGFKKYHCEQGDLLFINWGAILTGDDFGADTAFDGITMTEAYMRRIFGGQLPDLFLSPGQCFSLHLTESEQSAWRHYMLTLHHIARMGSVSDTAINSLFVSTLKFTMSLYKSKVVPRQEYWSRNKQTVERFVRLVNDHAKTEHEIEFYASKLCMTSHYLGMIIKKETGITAKEWIDKTLAIQIQVELKYTTKSLKVIAEEFNFVSLSSLCKFFKRRTGITASTYRSLPEP